MSEPTDSEKQRLSELILPPAIYSGYEAAEKAGIEEEIAMRVWGAIGMAHIDPSVVAFNDRDVDALRTVAMFLKSGYPIENILVVSRLLGRVMSRVTDAQVRALVDRIGSEARTDELATGIERIVEVTPATLGYIFRRHLWAAVQHLPEGRGEEAHLMVSVGFVDLVSFSRISDEVEEKDLTALVTLFEELVLNACVEAGVRLVKSLGDAVMFVAPDADSTLRAAVAIIDRVQQHDDLPKVRAGLDFGGVVTVGGDYFGRPVNVASRITGYARAGSIMFSEGFREALTEEYDVVRLGPRRLKNLGLVSLYRLRKAP
ncbi:MAG TPA: adenylate/guanylate cyclase domain-containing protein [Actinomycetota bacterium]|nr:adenylate/guanylate cyclase domain-containing protein [Actinomycetota bacterium]